ELGDYDPDEHFGNYVADFKLLLKQTTRIEEKIAEIHQTQLSGRVPAVAEMNFLHKACQLDTYGIDPHPVKRKHLIGFKCPTQAACKHLWKCALEQRYFFAVESSSEVPAVTTGGGLFSRGSKFRYSGRVEKEVVELMKNFQRDPPQFQRSFMHTSSFHHKSESYPTTPATPSRDYETDFPDLHYMNHSAPVTENLDSITSTDSTSPKHTNHSTQMAGSLSDLTLPEHEEAPTALFETVQEQQVENTKSEITQEPEGLAENTYSVDQEVSVPSLQASTPQLPENPEQDPHVEFPIEVSTSTEPQKTEMNFEWDLKIPKQKNISSCQSFMFQPVNVVRVAILASLFILLIFWCLLVVVMESDSPLFSDIRKIPELLVLRQEYYEPTKDYIMERLKFLF
ncbi:FERM domain-containing protein 3-like, partial [Limulus polyphemus]|uniref:FERM domain-containing protein 3-like n=1 Tax=Limulus polyphemus TaxID=6850 RepID=A0ABM1TCT5_LIMPO